MHAHTHTENSMQPVRSVRIWLLHCVLALMVPVLCLETASAQSPVFVDVSISLFQHSADMDGEESLQTAVSRAETRYMPVMLALRLIDTDQWGAVRVTPLPDPGAELSVTATILESTHRQLSLEVNAIDSSGRVWLDRVILFASNSDVLVY